MPKSQYVDPGKVFQPGYLDFESIPLCRYNKTLDEEKQIYSKEDFMRIYHDMRTIREFEKGSTKNPTLITFEQLRLALGLSLDELFLMSTEQLAQRGKYLWDSI